MYGRYTKSILDRALVIVFFPVIIFIVSLISLCVLLFDGQPIFFTQKRYGKNQKPFHILKFKTMVRDESKSNELDKWSHGNVRITRLGKLLRSTSLDELPNLFSVLTGDMSLIGPRPLLKNHIENYRGNEALRHNVKPGLTGLAQVMGRDDLSWRHKYKYDLFYVEKLCFMLDIWIFIKTIIVIISRSGQKDHGVNPPQ